MIDLGIIHHWPSKDNAVYIKQMHLPRGHYAETHKHEYDHFGLLASGHAIVEMDGVKTEYLGPCVIEIEAGKTHTITALEDITWFCIHHVEENDPDKIDQVLIKKEY